ncbi:hypothetical protein Ae201684_000477 [Aphanomyces euteiches]|uniref:Uncharacterized protein n=1 Tax=Aphanomyces euteiches TaxID=100861 RepID=A0A6G0XXK4_9STRA|nr:hypothetical protein Ae201684_000477 [Aphanomyces euteiches]KAH9134042.1 hypothetical protein AeRB84_020094 [Aphanomyces euteiches]
MITGLSSRLSDNISRKASSLRGLNLESKVVVAGMPSTTTHHGLVCAGISSSIESMKARRSVIPAKKPLNFGTDVSKLGRPKSNTSPRTEEDVDKLVQVLRHSLQLNKVELPVCNNGTPPVVKRRVYLSPRERIQSVTSQLSMSVMGTSPGLRPSTEKLPSLTPSIESTLSPEINDEPVVEMGPRPAPSKATTRIGQSKSTSHIPPPASNNPPDNDPVGHTKSCSDLDSIHHKLDLCRFQIDMDDDVETAPSSPFGPWVPSFDGQHNQTSEATSPRSRLLSLSPANELPKAIVAASLLKGVPRGSRKAPRKPPRGPSITPQGPELEL